MRQWGHVWLGRQGRHLRMRLSARPLHPRGGSWVARPSRRLSVSMGLRMVLSHRGMPWWLGALRFRSMTLSFCLSLSENLLLCQKSLGSRRQDRCWRCDRQRDWSSHSGVFATALLVIIIVSIVIVAVVGIRYLVGLQFLLRSLYHRTKGINVDHWGLVARAINCRCPEGPQGSRHPRVSCGKFLKDLLVTCWPDLGDDFQTHIWGDGPGNAMQACERPCRSVDSC